MDNLTRKKEGCAIRFDKLRPKGRGFKPTLTRVKINQKLKLTLFTLFNILSKEPEGSRPRVILRR